MNRLTRVLALLLIFGTLPAAAAAWASALVAEVNPAVWAVLPDVFPVGANPDYREAAGGVALGSGVDAAGQLARAACGRVQAGQAKLGIGDAHVMLGLRQEPGGPDLDYCGLHRSEC